MVIGSELCYQYNESMEQFISDMIRIGNKFKQDAVLILDMISIPEYNDRDFARKSDAYKTFNTPEFADDEYFNHHEFIDRAEFKETQATNNADVKDTTIIYDIHGVYYHCKNGNIENEFNNVSPEHIGNYFTQLWDIYDGNEFTVMASTYICPKYVGWNYVSNMIRPSKYGDTEKIIKYLHSNRYYREVHNINCSLNYKPYILAGA